MLHLLRARLTDTKLGGLAPAPGSFVDDDLQVGFHRRKAVALLKVSRCRSPVPGGGGPGGLSLATGTSQAPQLVAPEANIRRDDHRGLHDARRRFNLAKSHGAR